MTGGHLELITENRYGDAMYIMENHFLEGQPLCGAFGVKWSKSFERLSLTALKDNLSVMSVSNKTNEVMGILINSVLKQTDSNDSVDIEDESLKALYEFLAHKDDEIDLFNSFGLGELFEGFLLGVNTNYRRLGVGTALAGTSLALAKELGFKAIKADGTSNFSQHIFEKFGAEAIAVLPYDKYKYKDKYISESAGAHTCTKILLLKLD